ncbi:conserved membrane hypothetical protein [Candidatus Terasakiella magnetica]|nr:conserved membrane hypothetical protein [Candidatus Terasakiella magnetica]
MVHHVFIRSLLCVAFVMGTYNPSGYCYLDWLREGVTTIKAAIGIAIVVIYSFLVWVVLGSLSISGAIAGLALTALVGHQIYLTLGPEAQVGAALQMIALTCFALFLGVGLSWPSVMTQLSGQVHKRYLSYAGKKNKSP